MARRIGCEGELEHVSIGANFAAAAGKLSRMSAAAKVCVRLCPVMIEWLTGMMVGAVARMNMNEMTIADLDHICGSMLNVLVRVRGFEGNSRR